MDAVITKTEVVMDFFNTVNNTAIFIYADEDTLQILRQVYIPIQTWEQLGSPEKITVAIAAGDTLNEES